MNTHQRPTAIDILQTKLPEEIKVEGKYELSPKNEKESGNLEVSTWTQIDGLTRALERVLNEQGELETVLKGVRENEIFDYILNLPETSNLDKNGKNTAQLVPLYSDYPYVISVINATANDLAVALTKSHTITDPKALKENIFIALINKIRVNLLKIVHMPMIRALVDMDAYPPGLTSYHSPSEIKKAIKAIEAENSESEESIPKSDEKLKKLIENLNIIGGFSSLSSEKQDHIVSEVKTSITKARIEFENMTDIVRKKILKELEEANDDDDATNHPEIDLPQVHKDIAHMHPYEMARSLFLGNHIGPGEYNDIQVILAMGFTLFKQKINPTRKRAETDLEFLSKTLQTKFLKELEQETKTGTEKIYIYKNGKFKLRYTNKLDLREIEIEGGSHPILINGLSIKEDASIMKKAFLDSKNADMEIEDTTDLLRSRYVLWDINSQEMKGEKSNLVKKIIQKAGSCMGLRLTDKRREDLEPNEFMIKPPDQDVAMTKYCLYGKSKNGTRIEIQFIPKDTHEVTTALNSPLSHQKYKEDQMFKLYLKLVPRSISPITYEVLTKVRRKYKTSRESTQRAATTLLENPST